MNAYLIYGVNGCTGALTAREAVRRGHRPILAGRNAKAVAALASGLNLPQRTLPVDDRAALAAGVPGVRLAARVRSNATLVQAAHPVRPAPPTSSGQSAN